MRKRENAIVPAIKIMFLHNHRLTTEIPPRRKRRLDLVHCDDKPEVHRIITADMRTLYMTRYHGGTKGPVLLIHGLGCSSGIFTLDTIRENLVEHLVRRKYDVWLADWRASACSRYVSSECSLDDVIKFDVPAFVAKIFDVTEKISLQVNKIKTSCRRINE